jgi:hypothetical protein
LNGFFNRRPVFFSIEPSLDSFLLLAASGCGVFAACLGRAGWESTVAIRGVGAARLDTFVLVKGGAGGGVKAAGVGAGVIFGAGVGVAGSGAGEY